MSEASPIYGVTIPDGYRGWERIAPAQEGEPLDELAFVSGHGLRLRRTKVPTTAWHHWWRHGSGPLK
jgi:hypothetical protein